MPEKKASVVADEALAGAAIVVAVAVVATVVAAVHGVVTARQQHSDCPEWIVAWCWNSVSMSGSCCRWQAIAADRRRRHPYGRCAFVLQLVLAVAAVVVVEPEFVELELLSVDLTELLVDATVDTEPAVEVDTVAAAVAVAVFAVVGVSIAELRQSKLADWLVWIRFAVGIFEI